MPLSREMEVLIVRRLKAGEKAIAVARSLKPAGVPTWRIYETAFVHGIPLKSGAVTRPHDPARYAERLDRRYGPGAAARLLRLAKSKGLRQTAKAFGWSWQWTHECYYKLGGKREELAGDNPTTRKKFIRLMRPDVTAGKVRRLAKCCHSQKEMAALLQCSNGTIRHRADHAGENNIQLPIGYERRDLTPAKIQRSAANCRSIAAMMAELHASRKAILRRAKKSKIPLPDGRWGPRPGTPALLERIHYYLRRRYPVIKIAKILKKKRLSIHGYLIRYPGYFAGIPRRRRGQRRMPSVA